MRVFFRYKGPWSGISSSCTSGFISTVQGNDFFSLSLSRSLSSCFPLHSVQQLRKQKVGIALGQDQCVCECVYKLLRLYPLKPLSLCVCVCECVCVCVSLCMCI